MKVTITKKTELEDPRLELTVFLETGQTRVEIKYTCPDCAGHGCHSKGCRNTINLEPEEVLATLGEDAKPLLKKVFSQILGEQPPSGKLDEYLVNPPLGMVHWHENLEALAKGLRGDLVIVNRIGTVTCLVQATPLVVDLLKQAQYGVSPNGTKRAI